MSEEELAEATIEQVVGATEDQAPQAEIGASDESQPEPTADEKAAEDKKKAEAAFQKRANKMTADKYKEKERADKAERELAELKAGQPTKELNIESFDYDEDALLQAKIQQGIQQGIASNAEQQRKVAVDAERAKLATKFNTKVEEANLDNFVEVLEQFKSVRPPMELVDTILGDENSPQLIYYLGNNLTEADQLANANPFKAGKMLAEISLKITNNKPSKKLTQASEPIQTLRGGGTPTKNKEDMSMEEIMALE